MNNKMMRASFVGKIWIELENRFPANIGDFVGSAWPETTRCTVQSGARKVNDNEQKMVSTMMQVWLRGIADGQAS